LLSGPAYAQRDRGTNALSLDSYLAQVAGKNEGYLKSKKAAEAYEARSDEWRLITSPNVFGSVQFGTDKTETASPTLSGTQTDTRLYSAGISQKTNFGLDAKLSYNYADTEIQGASPAFLTQPHFITTGPALELTQSLWRNGFGSETQATQEARAASVEAQKLSEIFAQSQLKAQAETAYWRLAVAREALDAMKQSLDRTVRGRDWTAGRSRLELTDRADLYQQDAAVASRQMDVQAAENEEKSAARAFNTMRGQDSNEVPEALAPITDDVITRLSIPKRDKARADVQAAESQAKAAKASSRTGEESSKPNVDLFMKAGLGGRDVSGSEAVSEGFTTDHPNYTVGVRLSMPLAQGIAARARQSYRVEAESAELGYRRKAFESEREWNDLVQRFDESKQRLELARKLEQAQKLKLDAERARHRLGRSTTYQVIQFEGDYANAQLSRIRLAQEVLGIYSQMKTYGGAQ
jgi:outer membrane protein TolC